MTEQEYDYPAHSDTFELFYYMGEARSLQEVAKLRFTMEYPDVTPGSLEYNIKFPSFYTKIKRWSAKEKWSHWVSKKTEHEQTLRETEMREHNKGLIEMTKMYRRMVRYAISAFAQKVKDGDIVIRNMTEVKRMIELDNYLTTILKSTPSIVPGIMQRSLSDGEKTQIDSVFEFIHKRAIREIDIETEDKPLNAPSASKRFPQTNQLDEIQDA